MKSSTFNQQEATTSIYRLSNHLPPRKNIVISPPNIALANTGLLCHNARIILNGFECPRCESQEVNLKMYIPKFAPRLRHKNRVVPQVFCKVAGIS